MIQVKGTANITCITSHVRQSCEHRNNYALVKCTIINGVFGKYISRGNLVVLYVCTKYWGLYNKQYKYNNNKIIINNNIILLYYNNIILSSSRRAVTGGSTTSLSLVYMTVTRGLAQPPGLFISCIYI